MSDDVFIEYNTRRLQTIPCSLYGHVKDTSICNVIDYAVEEMRSLRFWGSRFMGFHITRLLHQNIPLPTMTDKTLRSTFVCVAQGARPSKDEEVSKSLDLWNSALGDTSKVKLPSIAGLNTITTSTFEEYFVSFKNYHLYGMQQHWSYFISMKYDLTKKKAGMVVRHICESYKLNVFETMSSMDNDEVTRDTKTEVLRVADLEKQNCPSLSTLEEQVKWHYCLANRLKNLEVDRAKKLVAMAPFCSGQLSYVEICKKGMSDLVHFATSAKSDGIIKSEVKRRFVQQCYEFASKEGAHIDTLFNLPNRNNWVLSPTFKTNGYALSLIWQKNGIRRKKVTPKKYAEHCEKKKVLLKTWDDEVARAQKAGVKPDMRKRYALDKQPMVEKGSNKIYPSKDQSGFENGQIGVYSQSILHKLNIESGTPIYSVDPGMHDIVSCAKNTWIEGETEYSLPEKNMHSPTKSKSLSSREFYGRIRVGKKIKPIEGLSECSLKEINPTSYLEKLSSLKDFVPIIFSKWGSKKSRKSAFKQRKKKQHLYDTIVDELFPEENSVVVMGNGKIQTTMKGTTTSPLGKITKEIIKKRRMVFVNEAFTTKRCSWCQKSELTLKALLDTQKGPQVTNSGKTYYPKIHGLRQCQHCTRTWNRDFNAARNIFFNMCSYVSTDSRRDYLCRKTS